LRFKLLTAPKSHILLAVAQPSRLAISLCATQEHQTVPRLKLLWLFGFSCVLAGSISGPGACASLWDNAFAVTDVTIVPMTCDCELRDQTLVVRDGKIVAFGPVAKIRVPANIFRISGRGLFLMPGLHDMHVHEFKDEEFTYYLANGVTTILNMQQKTGDETLLARRAALESGAIAGPRMFTCGPAIYGEQHTAQSAVAMVDKITAGNFDCVKVRGTPWTEEEYRAVAEATARNHILFMGHAPRNLPFSLVLNVGTQRIVHLEEIVYTTKRLNDWLESKTAGDDPQEVADVVRDTARQLVARHMWVIPTEIVLDTYLMRASPEGQARLADRPYLRFLDPLRRREWADAKQSPDTLHEWERQVALQHFMLRVFHEEGVQLAAGTDSELGSNLNLMPGWALHDELAIYQSVGMTPYEALRAATVAAAQYMNETKEGVIAVGSRADFILLEHDPLKDVANTAAPLATIAGGRWYARAQLDEKLKAIQSLFQPLEQRMLALDPALQTGDPATIVKALDALTNPPAEVRAFVESEINRIGYRLMSQNKIAAAVDAFQVNVQEFPNSANAYDSLGEALLKAGDRDRAIAAYQKALVADPNYASSKQALEQLLAPNSKSQ
jgi:imidazolonepropionase-like amidohydrolase